LVIMVTATIHDIQDWLIKDKDLNENEKEILKLVMSANCFVKSAVQWPEGRETYLRDCRNMLVQAIVYLDEELEDDRKT
jgi:hypothetical protein